MVTEAMPSYTTRLVDLFKEFGFERDRRIAKWR